MAQSFRTAISFDGLASASSQALAIKVDGDSQNRVLIDAGGKITWGAGGSSAGDTTLYRSAANTLKTDDAFTAASLAVTGEFTLPTSDGSNNQVLVTNGSGTVSWANQSGGGGSPGGSDTQFQYNNGGSFGGATNLIYDDANDRVGIGTSSPAGNLQVVSQNRAFTVIDSGTNNYAEAGFTSLGGDGPAYGHFSGYDIGFKTGTSRGGLATRMHIDNDGNVGIGTTTPGYKLTVFGTGYISGDFTVDQYNPSDAVFHVDSSNNRVGIGTTSPATALHVTGDFTTDGDIFGTSDTNFFVGNDSNERILFQESSNRIFFYVNGAYRASFTSGGDYVPYADSTYDLGSTSLRWAEIHADKLLLASTTDTGSDTSDGALTIGLSSGQHLTFDGNEIQSKSNDSTAGTLHLETDGGNAKFGNNTQLTTMVIKASQTQIYSSAAALELHNTASGDQSVYHAYYNNSGTRYGYMGYPSNDDMYFKNENSGGQMYSFSPGSYMYWHVAGAYELRLSASELRPYTNEGLNLGASGAAWNHFYLGQGNTFSSGGYWTLRSRDSDRQVMEYTSSERFKKDIVDLPLDEAYQVLDARPIKFRGIDDDSSVPLEAGLSAESLHNSGFEYAVRYDEGHWGETPRAVYYEMLTAPLIKICKDQKDRIESLEAKVAALEAA